MNALLEMLIELSVGLVRFVARNFRFFLALFIGAGFGLALGASLASFGCVDIWMVLIAVVISAVVVTPKVLDYFDRLIPRK